MSRHRIVNTGGSRSFPDTHALLESAADDGDIVVYIGNEAGARYIADESKTAILIELVTECLGVHTGEQAGREGSNVLGFSRFRVGDGDPSDLVELVRQPNTADAAIAAATKMLEDVGLEVALCNDFSGRILDRLVRPYYNDALKALDEGLATADDFDLTVRLGLGYRDGPIRLLEETGLHHHHDVTKALFDVYGERFYAPARRAAVAKMRQSKG